MTRYTGIAYENGRSYNDPQGFRLSPKVIGILSHLVTIEHKKMPKKLTGANGTFLCEIVNQAVLKVKDHDQEHDDEFNVFARVYADYLVLNPRTYHQVDIDLGMWIRGAMPVVVLGLYRGFWTTDGVKIYNDKCGEY